MRKLSKNRRPTLHSCRLRFGDFNLRLEDDASYMTERSENIYFIIEKTSPVDTYYVRVHNFLTNPENDQYIIRKNLTEQEVVDFYLRCDKQRAFL